MRSSNSAELVMHIPPSPVVMILFAKKEKVAISPKLPTLLPLNSAPWASAQSSITFRSCFFAISMMPSISHACPYTCTGMIALVLGLIAFSISSGEMVQLSRSTSTSTGVALASNTALMVAAKVRSGIMTSSPSPTPSASKAR